MLQPQSFCRPCKPLLLAATAVCFLMGSGQSEAACTNPPVIGWPEGKVPAVTAQTPILLEIQYHDQCSGEKSTYVRYRRVGPRTFFETIKTEGFNQGGWRKASRSGLRPDTAYEFEVGVVGSDGVLRKVNQTFSTLKDPACQEPLTAFGTDGRIRKSERTFRTRPDPNAPPKLLTAAVVLGDSFSSGEGGRWRGNGDLVQRSADPTLGGTDRAGHVDLKFVYEAASVDNLCHRSTAAPITYLRDLQFKDRFERVFNLACSGARAKNLWPLGEGGEAYRGEAPQIAQLGELARQHDIKLIVVGIGGNDMGFADAITECIMAWVTKHMTPVDSASCIGALESDIIRRIDGVQPKLEKTVELIRKEMSRRNRNDYQIVLMGYPNIIPDFDGFKYAAGDRRLKKCPFNGADAQWIEDRLVPALNAMVASAAREAGVSFISLENAFDGHRLCEGGTTRPVNLRFVTDKEAEWVRFVDYDTRDKVGYLAKVVLWQRFFSIPPIALVPSVVKELKKADQGDLQESLHPNHFGQQAVGTCLRRFWSEFGVKGGAARSLTCRNGGSGRATDMALHELSSRTAMQAGLGGTAGGLE